MKHKKLILGVTLGGSSRLLDGQAAYFRDLGYDVYLVSEDHYKEHLFCKREEITHLPVDIDSEINLVKDLKSLSQIYRHFIKVKPDIVNVGTPKMGLLGMMAAKLSGINKRIYTCRGFRFETELGLKRKILIWTEKISAHLAHKVIYVSPSLLEKAVDMGICKEEKALLIEKGSSNGVNIEFFNFNQVNEHERKKLINKYNLYGKLVIGFVGRVSKHKGSEELVAVFERLQKQYADLRLIMMGHIDCSTEFENYFRSNPNIIHIPFQDNVPLYMSLFDIFVLPSWREGFPNVPIQAAAMGLPVIVSDATGCIDAVKEGYNGKIFKCGDENDLYDVLYQYIENKELREKHGVNGKKWALNFNSRKIWNGIKKVYEDNV